MKILRRKYITMLAVVVVGMMCAFFLTATQDTVAKVLPDVDELQVVSVQMNKERYEYTGDEIRPEILQIIFEDSKGNTVKKTKDELMIEKYTDNVKPGVADIQVQVSGYLGHLLLENVFSIYPTKIANLKLDATSKTWIDLQWDSMIDVEGYCLYRSEGTEENYVLLQKIEDASVTAFQDTQIETNKVYYYKVSAYLTIDSEPLQGAYSDSVKYFTPLDTPVLTSVAHQSHNTLQIQWNAVPGAIGYQVFKADSADGEFKCIAELTDGSETSYSDATCKCGIPAYYYVKACQALEAENVYGLASNVLSGKTGPNTVSLRGTLVNDNTQVNLSWKKSTAAQGYEIYRSVNSGSYKLVCKIEDADVLSWSDSGLEKKHRYAYRIRPYAVVNGSVTTGSYSGTFVKDAIYEYNYTPGEVSANIEKILEFQGTPYVYGGKTPEGWDCSGFTRWVMRECMGVDIPYSAAEQGAGGRAIDKNDMSVWKPGDILAYSNGSRISHVALYIGNGKMIHALNEKRDTFVQGVEFYESWDPGNSLAKVRRYFE